MKRTMTIGALRIAAVAVLGALVLAGCSGGEKTAPNLGSGANGPDAGTAYNGPPAGTADIQAFKINVYDALRVENRCGSCHGVGGQSPNFVRGDDVNLAYQQALTVADLANPSLSTMVAKVGGGHNCWLADNASCGAILTTLITRWAEVTQTGAGRQITLQPPIEKNPGASKRLPADPPAGYAGVHALLTEYCTGCHVSTAETPQSPYFASADLVESYEAARSKINLDDPTTLNSPAVRSRLVLRLRDEAHNCWSNCVTNAGEMLAAINTMAAGIAITPIDQSLVLSKALTLYDGTVASGGNRFDTNAIALYEFKTGKNSIAYDTSGVDPALDLNISGQEHSDFEWVGGWGIRFNTPAAKAQGLTTTSRKLHNLISTTGEYSIEAWVVPGNVAQEDARIISYSGGQNVRNFTMGQTLYNYDFFARSSATDSNGAPQLSTADADEDLQASLQHVVMTFDPVNGRRIYVNGEFTGDVDGEGGGTLGDWDTSFALVLGNEVSNDRPWQGTVRLLAIHNRALTQAQIQQNFAVGVGQKYFLLFGVSHLIDVPQAYVMFEVSQYDSYGYLFTNPKFISLDPAAQPGSIAIEGMRIGVNGAEPIAGQAYRALNTIIDNDHYTAAAGQLLSSVGTVIGLEAGPESDEFFLCFDRLGARTSVCSTDATPQVPVPVDPAVRPSDIGVRTFDKINASMAAATGISAATPRIRDAYSNIRQSLPATDDVGSFLPSHQTAIAQLAIQYCDALVERESALPSSTFFPSFSFSSNLATSGQRDLVIDPLIQKLVGTSPGTPLESQPAAASLKGELNTLIAGLCPTGCANTTRTKTVVKATCAALLGSATTLVN